MNEVLHSRRTFSVFLIFFGVDAITNNGYFGGEISVHFLLRDMKSTAISRHVTMPISHHDWGELVPNSHSRF